MINPSKPKEGAQREMGQTGTPHGVPLSGNGMSPATGGLWVLGCCYLFQPRPGGNLRGAAPTLPTDSRPGTPAVNARLHLTPNPRSAPGTIRTVRLAHHVGLMARSTRPGTRLEACSRCTRTTPGSATRPRLTKTPTSFTAARWCRAAGPGVGPRRRLSLRRGPEGAR